MLSQIRTQLNQALPKAIRPGVLAEKYLNRRLRNERVLYGPFRGMRYISESVGSVLIPKVLGTYEIELNPVLQKYLSSEPRLFIDVGAAEGYFAVGLAWRCPQAKVIAFEADETGRKMLTKLAKANGLLERIEINGFCDEQKLLGILNDFQPTLVIVDIEGGEAALLSLDVVKKLKQVDLIVELHPWIIPEIELMLTDRFKLTHHVNVIDARPRVDSDLPFGMIFNQLLGRWLTPKLNELRPEPMRWLHLVARE